MKNHKWPSDFGLYKQVQIQKKSLLIKLTILGTAFILLLFAICYTTLHAVNSNAPIENTNSTTNMSSPSAEKLTASSVSIEKQEVEHISPRPFINDLRGASPSAFSPISGPSTASNTPQFSNHKIPAQPNNIQDIIQYLSENAHRQKELIREEQNFANSNRERDKFKLFGTIQGSRAPHRQHQQDQNSGFAFPKLRLPEDPFFAFKPQDPSDINLLAPSSFRFAPAILSSSFYRNRQKLLQEAANVPVNVSNHEFRKPLSLTLNIFPSPLENESESENRIRFQGPGVTPRYRYAPIGLQRARDGVKPGRMVVHLNVYPGLKPRKVFPSEEDQNSN